MPVALITGAGRGIGRATAIELGQRGYNLVLVSRTRQQVEETLELAGSGMVLVGDVSNPIDAQRIVADAMQGFGRIDALINNAGMAPMASVEQTTFEQWRAVIDTNLSAAFYLSKALWPAFRKQQGGVIVNISSQAARDPFAGFAAYGSAKAALNLLTLVLAREGAPINVRAHAIAPGAVETGMFRELVSVEQYPPEKTLAPAEVAEVIAGCVCGDLRYTSGEVIYLTKSR